MIVNTKQNVSYHNSYQYNNSTNIEYGPFFGVLAGEIAEFHPNKTVSTF